MNINLMRKSDRRRDDHRDDKKRFVVREDEKLTASIELEWAIGGRRERAFPKSWSSPF
jgi:hypothetical protein